MDGDIAFVTVVAERETHGVYFIAHGMTRCCLIFGCRRSPLGAIWARLKHTILPAMFSVCLPT